MRERERKELLNKPHWPFDQEKRISTEVNLSFSSFENNLNQVTYMSQHLFLSFEMKISAILKKLKGKHDCLLLYFSTTVFIKFSKDLLMISFPQSNEVVHFSLK